MALIVSLAGWRNWRMTPVILWKFNTSFHFIFINVYAILINYDDYYRNYYSCFLHIYFSTTLYIINTYSLVVNIIHKIQLTRWEEWDSVNRRGRGAEAHVRVRTRRQVSRGSTECRECRCHHCCQPLSSQRLQYSWQAILISKPILMSNILPNDLPAIALLFVVFSTFSL